LIQQFIQEGAFEHMTKKKIVSLTTTVKFRLINSTKFICHWHWI